MLGIEDMRGFISAEGTGGFIGLNPWVSLSSSVGQEKEKPPLPRMKENLKSPLAIVFTIFLLGCQIANSQAQSLGGIPFEGLIHPLQVHIQVGNTLAYIDKAWNELTRTIKDIPIAVQDVKVPHDPGKPWALYISNLEDSANIQTILAQTLAPSELSMIEIRTIPDDPEKIEEHGLLFLPYPYVVPGGRFNEMYGWDSYFINLGLLASGRINLAKSIVENYMYQVRHYGKVLNANRTYYLGRSNPPFMTRAILEVFEHTKDLDWLKRTLPFLLDYYKFWTTPPHVLESGGLSRYFASGKGPAPEVVWSEVDEQGTSHYDRVKEYYEKHTDVGYDKNLFFDAQTGKLTDLFYTGDRSVRESGFDPTARFGEFGVDIVNYFPVCLNTLLYIMEHDISDICLLLNDSKRAALFEELARRRKNAINNLFWDEKEGMYFDYQFRSQIRRVYPFLTTFYPLWAGIASKDQAKRIVKNLSRFETSCGLQASLNSSGNQWDAPFAWAPLQWIAVKGLLRYGYRKEASRIAEKFIYLVTEECARTGTIREKYNAQACNIEVIENVQFGYLTNEVGFGWTNGVYLDSLPLINPMEVLY